MERFGRAMYRYRWRIVAIWLAVFLVASFFAPRITGVLKGGGYTIGRSQATSAYNILNAAYGYRALTFTAVFAANEPGGRRTLESAAARFRREATDRFGRTLTIGPPVRSQNGAIVFERIYSAPREDLGASLTQPLRALLPHAAVRGYLTGSSAEFSDMERVSDEDLRNIELVTLPLAALVLLFIFGSLVASATPVLMAPVAVTLSLAIIYFLGHRLNMSIFVLNTASMLGLGVAIDYSLFMVNRFREELHVARDLETAVGTTVATSGRAILVSACVVSLGFFSLTLMGVDMLRSIGLGGGIVTVLSMLVALTLLPAVLGILGDRINRWPVLPARFAEGHVWNRIAHAVMRRPVAIIAGVVAVIAVFALPAVKLRVGIPGPAILPTSVDSRAGNDLLSRNIGVANNSPVLVVVIRHPSTPLSTIQATGFEVLDRICASREVVGIATTPVPNSTRQIQSCAAALQRAQAPSAAQTTREQALARTKRVAFVAVFLKHDPSSSEAEHFVLQLRHQLPIHGYTIDVGGQTGGQIDFNNYLYSRFPLVVAFVVLAIYVVLLFAFRSLLLPLKAVLMNVFSILAAYGIVVFAFQQGHLSRLLDFTPVGNIDSIVPVFLFSVLFGISTDYEVFLLSRVQEEYRRTGNNEASVAKGLEVTGRIITSAAAVMIVVFAAFAFARLVVVKELGLGLAVAVFIDATLIRAMLVPATMRLLGRWNWWLPVRGLMTTDADQPQVQDRRAVG